MVGGEPSHADPAHSTKDSWLDRGWPLTRFLGYRPPPPHPHAAKDVSSHADHFLPTPMREKRRAKAQDKYEREHGMVDEGGMRRSESGTVVGSPDGSAAEKGKGQSEEQKQPSVGEKVRAKLWNMLLTLFGCFFGIAFGALGGRAPYIRRHNGPIIPAAFGAEAVLLYAAHSSPLTQPRNVIFGNTISAILGVCVAKLFLLHPGFKVGDAFGINWAACAISLALSLGVMQLLEITHPPGGATALLAVSVPQVSGMGWWYVPQILQTSLILLGWAMIMNNLGGRRYPNEWWWKSKWVVI
ncbi:hpp family protein [Rhodotorula toruloides]|uniref:BY PROTMAP: gi/472580702/gb/EMS18480.1/ hpp family protein [Rhodosporidium toruloides NP11] gi/647402928/emb/CDR49116.1/ RHTO0S23e00958g1_1 [Rhodosporidium toruloides] n=1 Tax=Rhodotorula toruloides TaxID=5286 RepID=A0A0K3C6C8_RHOTO|nr:hpp family protein [Rhodotorula toruloides]